MTRSQPLAGYTESSSESRVTHHGPPAAGRGRHSLYAAARPPNHSPPKTAVQSTATGQGFTRFSNVSRPGPGRRCTLPNFKFNQDRRCHGPGRSQASELLAAVRVTRHGCYGPPAGSGPTSRQARAPAGFYSGAMAPQQSLADRAGRRLSSHESHAAAAARAAARAGSSRFTANAALRGRGSDSGSGAAPARDRRFCPLRRRQGAAHWHRGPDSPRPGSLAARFRSTSSSRSQPGSLPSH